VGLALTGIERLVRRSRMSDQEPLLLAREAIQRGDEEAACSLLARAVDDDPENELAWLWLSAVIGDPVKEWECLQQVLRLNPRNEKALRHLARLKRAGITPPEPEPQPSTPRTPRIGQDVTYLQDERVRITTSQAMIEGQRYRMAGVTGARKSIERPSALLPFALIVAGVAILLAGLGALLLGQIGLLWAAAVGLVMAVAGLAWYRARKPRYTVVLMSASGKRRVLQAEEEAYADTVVAAVQRALAGRG
jgi:hypothetical protein